MRRLSPFLAAGLLVTVAFSAGDAQAQSRSRAGVAPSPRAAPTYPRRGSEQYSTPRSSSGAIQWNTPNASGNLGGPGAGGGGGNGG